MGKEVFGKVFALGAEDLRLRGRVKAVLDALYSAKTTVRDLFTRAGDHAPKPDTLNPKPETRNLNPQTLKPETCCSLVPFNLLSPLFPSLSFLLPPPSSPRTPLPPLPFLPLSLPASLSVSSPSLVFPFVPPPLPPSFSCPRARRKSDVEENDRDDDHDDLRSRS